MHSLILLFPMLYRFSEGLNTLGLLSQMKMHPNIFKEVFCSSQRTLKTEDLISLFKAELSFPGSNRWRLEKKVEGYWRDFLVDVEGKWWFSVTFLMSIIRFWPSLTKSCTLHNWPFRANLSVKFCPAKDLNSLVWSLNILFVYPGHFEPIILSKNNPIDSRC